VVFCASVAFCSTIRAQTVSISSPPGNSNFLAPATVTIEGEVDLPEGDWFELRVFRLPLRVEPPGYNSRIAAVHVATFTTDEFSLC
jgi:hypothetical protein